MFFPLLVRNPGSPDLHEKCLAMINRVESAAIERMTAEYPADGQVKAAPRTMELHRIHGILGTGWCKSAAWGKQRREGYLVGPNQGETNCSPYFLQRFLHSNNFMTNRPSGRKNGFGKDLIPAALPLLQISLTALQ